MLTVKERDMLKMKIRIVALYVDRDSQQWVARDANGDFWIIPVVDEPWKHREPFTPTTATELEPVPGHYKSHLGLTF